MNNKLINLGTSIQLPSVFLYDYSTKLDCDAFVVLLKLFKFYLNSEGDEIIIPFGVFEREIIDVSTEIMDVLGYWGLVAFNEKENTYILNITQIYRDNLQYSDNDEIKFNETFKINVGKKIIRKRRVKIKVKDFVEKFTSKYPPKLAEKLNTMIEGVIQCDLKNNKSVEVNTINFLISEFINIDDKLLEFVCDIYNKDHHGEKDAKYIHGILRNQSNQKKNENSHAIKYKISNKLNEIQQKNDEFNRRVQDNDNKEFGIKIALGNTESKAYQNLLKLKGYNTLKELYSIGVDYLTKNNREKEIYTQYDWL